MSHIKQGIFILSLGLACIILSLYLTGCGTNPDNCVLLRTEGTSSVYSCKTPDNATMIITVDESGKIDKSAVEGSIITDNKEFQ